MRGDKMRITAYSDKGPKRHENQDAYYVDDNNKFFIIADGMGGHNGGQIASTAVVAAVRDKLAALDDPSADDIKHTLKSAIEMANGIVFDLGKDELSGMGTTLIVCCIKDGRIYVASIGDSRLYLMGKDGRLNQITVDHSVQQSLKEIGIDENSAQKNLLTRAVGSEAEIEIDFFEKEIEKGDYILACTDGLTNAIADYELEHLIKAGTSAQALCELANARSGNDNVTIILYEL
jgi:protein phosphatase